MTPPAHPQKKKTSQEKKPLAKKGKKEKRGYQQHIWNLPLPGCGAGMIHSGAQPRLGVH